MQRMLTPMTHMHARPKPSHTPPDTHSLTPEPAVIHRSPFTAASPGGADSLCYDCNGEASITRCPLCQRDRI